MVRKNYGVETALKAQKGKKNDNFLLDFYVYADKIQEFDCL